MKRALLSKLFLLLFFDTHAQSNRLWASYYGGTGHEQSFCVVTDTAGNVFMAGITTSTTNIAFGGFQNSIGGGLSDAYLVKFDASGNRLWATYYGGNGLMDTPRCLATDKAGNVYMAGATSSQSNIASGGFQNTYGGGFNDAFLVKFDGAGNRQWATYYGGSSSDDGQSLCIDALGNVYMGGVTSSPTGIASGGFQNKLDSVDAVDAFLVKFSPSGNRIWATYFGGPRAEIGYGVAVDTSGNVYLTGQTNSPSGMTFNGFQNFYGGGNADAFLVKFSPSGNRIWATYYGGPGNSENAYSVATDSKCNVYMAGWTDSTSGIASGGFQNTYAGKQDAFLVKFNTAGSRLWGTYYGGPEIEEGGYVVTDELGYVYLTGDTYSSSGIASNAFQNNLMGMENEFVIQFDSLGNRICGTYFGAVHEEMGRVAVDRNGHVYLTGYTNSSSGIALFGFQNTFGGGNTDSYIAKFLACEFTGIDDGPKLNNVIVYPNPSTGSFIVDSPIENAQMVIYNALGEIIFLETLVSGKQQIGFSVNALSLYFYQVVSNGKLLASGKLVVNK